jgi:hypothetical protein
MIVSAFVKLHGKGVSTSERQEIDGMRLDKKILFISGTIIILLSVVITTSCLTSIVTSLLMDNGKALKTHDLETIGFDFEGKVPEFPMGDSGAGRHLFIHRYPIPAEGRVFGLEYLNDYEDGYAEKQERIVFLMLRPELEEWSILFRYDR